MRIFSFFKRFFSSTRSKHEIEFLLKQCYTKAIELAATTEIPIEDKVRIINISSGVELLSSLEGNEYFSSLAKRVYSNSEKMWLEFVPSLRRDIAQLNTSDYVEVYKLSGMLHNAWIIAIDSHFNETVQQLYMLGLAEKNKKTSPTFVGRSNTTFN